MLTISQNQICGVAGSHVRICRLRIKENGRGLMVIGVAYSSNSRNLSRKENLDGLLSKMFPESSTVTKARISEFSSKRWMNSGMAFHGEVLDAKYFGTSQRRRRVYIVGSLGSLLSSKVLFESEGTQVAPRSEPRKVGGQWIAISEMHWKIRSVLYPTCHDWKKLSCRYRKQKDIETMEKLTLSIQGECPMLFVRHLTPLECERLQGFPPGWTEVDT